MLRKLETISLCPLEAVSFAFQLRPGQVFTLQAPLLTFIGFARVSVPSPPNTENESKTPLFSSQQYQSAYLHLHASVIQLPDNGIYADLPQAHSEGLWRDSCHPDIIADSCIPIPAWKLQHLVL